jgi:hypothetical protein
MKPVRSKGGEVARDIGEDGDAHAVTVANARVEKTPLRRPRAALSPAACTC